MSQNLFGWDYQVQQVQNLNGTQSRFAIVYGEDGNVVNAKKDSYTLITTQDVSDLGSELISAGYPVRPFAHRSGEILGLNVGLQKRLTRVGEISYGASLYFPNNNGGSGKYRLFYKRLICGNGATRNVTLNDKADSVKIVHNMTKDYKLELMAKAVKGFFDMIAQAERTDVELDAIVIPRDEAMRRLNEWFYNEELPLSAKKEMTLNQFREKAALNPVELPFADRYFELQEAFKKEIKYNDELDLKLSAYTIYATATNYLSRRRERSRSSAPAEIQLERASEKLITLENLELVGI